MAQYQFVCNGACEYLPCHKTNDPESFNCLFCFCPLYALGANCGGSFTYTKDGIKDCSHCLFPHRKENYKHVIEKLNAVVEITKKKTRYGRLEKMITDGEERLAEIEEQMLDPKFYSSASKFAKLEAEKAQLSEDIDAWMEEWSLLSEELEL